ncbi:MAG: hypothetical protein H6721_04535 [Sandaracinus sp.]|nr:hypothetical protein [Sandaracinus sp.]MCB9620556.1 hypothetical protein [Sandaracinus sp.]MCB9631393.1 hypothetical protein [Sandaracinus sp.]
MALVRLDLRPAERVLRQFGCVVALVGAGLVGLAGIGYGPLEGAATWISWAVGGAALAFGLLALVAPRVLRWPFVVASVITYPLGFVLSWVVLVVLYFGLFVPTGLLFRAVGRDALRRKREPGTYWSEAPAKRPKSDYFKQY